MGLVPDVDVMGVLNKKRAAFRLGHASPNKIWAWLGVAAWGLAVLTPLRGAIIPDERRITWAPGVPGGIPSRPVIFIAKNHEDYAYRNKTDHGYGAIFYSSQSIHGRLRKYFISCHVPQ